MKKHVLNLAVISILAAMMTTSIGCSPDLAAKRTKISPIVGTWELTTVSQRGTHTRKMIINKDLTGTYQGRRNQQVPVTNLKLEENELSFNVLMKYRDREYPMEFKGTLDGTKLTGQWITSRGNRNVTGQKIPPTP